MNGGLDAATDAVLFDEGVIGILNFQLGGKKKQRFAREFLRTGGF